MDPYTYAAALKATLDWLRHESGVWDFGTFNRAINPQFYPLLNLPFPLPCDWDESRKTQIRADAKRHKREIFRQALHQIATGNDLELARKALVAIPKPALLTRKNNIRMGLFQPAAQKITISQQPGASQAITHPPPPYEIFDKSPTAIPPGDLDSLPLPGNSEAETGGKQEIGTGYVQVPKNEPEEQDQVGEQDEGHEEYNDEQDQEQDERQDKEYIDEQDEEEGVEEDAQSESVTFIKNHQSNRNEHRDITFHEIPLRADPSASPKLIYDPPSEPRPAPAIPESSVHYQKIDHKRCTLCCRHLLTNIDCTRCCGYPTSPIRHGSEFKSPPGKYTPRRTAAGSNRSVNTEMGPNRDGASLEQRVQAQELQLEALENRIQAQEDFAEAMRRVMRLKRELEESVSAIIDVPGPRSTTILRKRAWGEGD